MKQVLLNGYYGRMNVGDDAFVTVTTWAVRKFFSCKNVLATASKLPRQERIGARPLFVAEHWPGATRWNNYQRIRAAKRSDIIIWGGGSTLIHEYVLQRNLQMLDAMSCGTAFAVGLSIGPFKNSKAEDKCASFLRRLEFVGVRDRVSYARAQEIAPETNVQLTFDLAPLLSIACNANVNYVQSKRTGLGVSLCNYERFVGGDIRNEAKRIAFVAESIRQLAAIGVVDEVTLIDFNGHRRTGDAGVHRELAHQIGDCVRISHIAYQDDPIAVMQIVGRLRCIIAMRLHAAVFAFCTETPFLMLSYHEKCREWAKMVDVPSDIVLDAADLEVNDMTHQIENLMGNTAPVPRLSVADAMGLAHKNWSWLNT